MGGWWDTGWHAYMRVSQLRRATGGHALLCDIETTCTVRVVIPAAEELPEDGVVPIARYQRSSGVERDEDTRFLDTLWFDVPSCKIILQDANESFLGFGAILRTKFSRTKMAEENQRTSLVRKAQ